MPRNVYRIEYNGCEATSNRCAYGSRIHLVDKHFDSDLEAFQYAVAIQEGEDSYQYYLEDGFEPIESVEDAKDALNNYDPGFGNPVVFRIAKDGKVIYEDAPEYWSNTEDLGEDEEDEYYYDYEGDDGDSYYGGPYRESKKAWKYNNMLRKFSHNHKR